MLYTAVVPYDAGRVSGGEAKSHVLAAAALLFPASEGFDHETLHPLMPGREQHLANGQTICIVRVDCQGPDPN